LFRYFQVFLLLLNNFSNIVIIVIYLYLIKAYIHNLFNLNVLHEFSEILIQVLIIKKWVMNYILAVKQKWYDFYSLYFLKITVNNLRELM